MPTNTFQIPKELRNIKCSAPMTEDVCRDIIRYKEFINAQKATPLTHQHRIQKPDKVKCQG